jgi:endonuclease III
VGTCSITLVDLVAALRTQYGAPKAPKIKDPFVLAVRESIAYLVNDAKRDEVLARVEAQVGLSPQALLDVPVAALAELIKDGGMKPIHRATKVQTAAELVLAMGLASLKKAVRGDPVAARRLLKKFPGFGDPGVEKVLLYNGRWKGLAPDSNALRVLLRTGFGTDSSAYAKSYRSAAAAVKDQLPDDPVWLLAAHQLLRTHGQMLCKHSRPRCEACPVRTGCPSAD